jgi:methionyl-tRNA formyltransferase
VKVAFIGCVAFSRSALSLVVGLPGVELVGVVTRQASSLNADFTPLEDIAHARKSPVFLADRHDRTELAGWLRDLKPDVVYCLGWPNLLRRDVLEVPRLGCVGFHPAALPNNRGRHPVVWALALGLTETASTFFLMDEGADTGDIISQVPIAISNEDNAGTLYAKITAEALIQISTITAELQSGTLRRCHQPKGSGNSWRKRRKSDGQVDWRMDNRAIYNLVRALTRPYVGAHCIVDAREVKIWRTELADCRWRNCEPGKVIESDAAGITVKCGEGAITLLEHEFHVPPAKGSYL